jgi:hypothetical protein
MKPMGDPDYVYRPWSEERRLAARAAALKRLGTPTGYRMIYGIPVPEDLFEEIHDFAVRYRYDRQAGTTVPLWKVRDAILLILKLLK